MRRAFLSTFFCFARLDSALLSTPALSEKIIERAAERKIDFAKNEFAAQILYDCCRYLRSDAFAQFKIDYAEELLSLKLEAEVHEDGTDAD